MKRTNTLFIICFVVLAFSSCLKLTEYPPEPTIEFKSFVQDGDGSATLTIKFTDGDGDIGLEQQDTTGVFCTDSCIYHWNLFLEYYEWEDGGWVHYYIDWMDQDNVPFYYRVPTVTPTGQNPALVGEIALDMPGFYYLLTENDTARFEVKLVDRALHESNTVISDLFVKPN
jgi:hypothetical protein